VSGGERLLHVTTRSAWEAARPLGFYEGDTLEAEGFIHCCTPEQLAGVVQRYFPGGGRELIVLEIDPSLVTVEVRWEGGFPHLYGPLEIEAVRSASPLLA
jgi:uncharacterized protein (DUF952 family)